MKKEVGKEERNGVGYSLEKEYVCWALCLEAFLSLAGRNLRGDLRGGFSRIFTSSPGALAGSWSPLIGQ